MMAAAGIRTVAMLIFVGTSGFADAAQVRVFSTGAPAAAAKTIGAQFAAESGHQLTFTVGQPATIQRKLVAGEEADIVILPARVIARLSGSGVLRAGSAVDLARVGIGVVVRDSVDPPDISSSAAIRKLLLETHSVVYPDPRTGGGSTGRAIARMIKRMGIADVVNAKLTRISAIGGGVDLVAAGKAEVGLFNISEIMPIRGVMLVGPLPPEVQNYIVFAVAIPASNAAPEPAQSFIKMLTGPAGREAWQRAGLEPVAVGPSQK